MLAAAIGIVVELALQIAGVQPGQSGRQPTIAFTLQAVTGRTGRFRATVPPAERDHLAVRAKGWVSVILPAAAGSEKSQGGNKAEAAHPSRNRRCHHRFPQEEGRRMGGRMILLSALSLSACAQADVAPNEVDAGSAARGRIAIERLGCGACHAIPGIWPKGTTGPSLENFSQRGMIAGKLANRPDTLAAFLLDPSGTAMPRQPMSAQTATDIAAFLHADAD